MSGIVWEQPPTDHRPNRARKDWGAVAEALRSRPNQWAVIDSDISASTVTAWRRGSNRAFAQGLFEFRVVNVNKGRAEKVYARFVGEVVA